MGAKVLGCVQPFKPWHARRRGRKYVHSKLKVPERKKLLLRMLQDVQAKRFEAP